MASAGVSHEETTAAVHRYGARDHAFGTRLLAWRARAGLSQQEVATLLGVNERAVRAWEGGASYPDPDHPSTRLRVRSRRPMQPDRPIDAVASPRGSLPTQSHALSVSPCLLSSSTHRLL